MEIERINENTVKFYVSYIDIEDRGFEREEIWYNRERSEQLFWQMMDEVNYKEDFSVEGPLWIQVQALEKGLEIIVTKAQVSKNGENLELPVNDHETIDITVNDKVENMIGGKINKEKESEQEEDGLPLSVIVRLNEFEDVIQLSHYIHLKEEDDFIKTLYFYNGKYYLYLEFTQDMEERQEDILSQVFEYGDESNVTIHVLEAYGTEVMKEDVFNQVKVQFSA
ncbi:adaptor protein MecA [Virgibacillus sp. W0181]|uniref:adaptor protein MecA n=1 Tax=Virgibacillus sp. W0181 TaxID=3391581 RepID=UPI003F4454E1